MKNDLEGMDMKLIGDYDLCKECRIPMSKESSKVLCKKCDDEETERMNRVCADILSRRYD